MNIKKTIAQIIYYTPLKSYFLPRLPYNFSVTQLCFLCHCIKETASIEGDVAEIGCYRGGTTIFLRKYMNENAIQKEYIAIDTFSSFPKEDIEFEVNNREKTKSMYKDEFVVNSKKWFDKTMQLNDIDHVKSIQADINVYDLTSLSSLSFVLLDVDLFRPIKKGLYELYSIVSPGGIIVVDDCSQNNSQWDGAAQAYQEFMSEKKLPIEIKHGKLGIIKKTI